MTPNVATSIAPYSVRVIDMVTEVTFGNLKWAEKGPFQPYIAEFLPYSYYQSFPLTSVDISFSQIRHLPQISRLSV